MSKQEARTIHEAREALAARKENRRKQSPKEIAQKMYRMNFEGNIVPHSWYVHIKRENGRPYPIAVILLSEIVYWYRPEEVKNETTGQIIGLRKRYGADKLRRTYDSFADEFGFTKRQVKDALKHLESMEIIDLDFRDVFINDRVIGNALFIGLDPDRLAEITYRLPSDVEVIDPPSVGKTSGLYQVSVNGMPEKRQTNTETTPETTPETTEDIPPIGENSAEPDETKGESDKESEVDALRGASDIGGIADKVLSGQNGRASFGDFSSGDTGNEPAAVHADVAGLGGEHGRGKETVADDNFRDCSDHGGGVNGDTVVDPLLFGLARRTEQAQQREGAWSVPAEAGGADPWADGVVDTFCQVLAGIDPDKLPGKKRRDWARKLCAIAGEWEVTPEVMIAAILAIPESAIAWKMANYTSPFKDSFAEDVGAFLSNGGKIPDTLRLKGAQQHERQQPKRRRPDQWDQPII